MNEKRFFTKVNNKGRLVIIDKECHTELFDMTLACEVLNRLDLKLKHYNEVNGEQQATISQLKEENEQLKEELQRFKKYVFSEDNILCYKCEHCIKKDIYVVDCEMKGKVDVHGLCSLFREVKV